MKAKWRDTTLHNCFQYFQNFVIDSKVLKKGIQSKCLTIIKSIKNTKQNGKCNRPETYNGPAYNNLLYFFNSTKVMDSGQPFIAEHLYTPKSLFSTLSITSTFLIRSWLSFLENTQGRDTHSDFRVVTDNQRLPTSDQQ